MAPVDFDTCRAWMADGTAAFAAAVRGLDDAAFARPSALPGWTNAHVVSHVAGNADAIGNLLAWARTGVETPMYASPERRAEAIEAGAARPPAALRAALAAADGRLAAAMDALPADRWRVAVRTAQGRTVPASEAVWMRTREVWVHAGDLGTGAAPAIPAGVCAALLTEALAAVAARDPSLSVSLRDPETGRSWSTGDPGTAILVEGPVRELTRYVLRGRAGGVRVPADGAVPPMPRWL